MPRVLYLLALIVTAIGSHLPFASAAPTDIVVFLSDDHTWTDSTVYGDGDVPTPNMQRIASLGTTLNNAFVASPSCAPSRAALLTGLYPANNGAEANHSRPRADIKKLPAYLQDLGYEVVSFGKVGHYAQTPEYGFDIARHYGYHEDIAIPEAIKWLQTRKSDKPLCLFVGTNWPHVPWPNDTEFDPAMIDVPPHHVDTEQTRLARARYYAAVTTMDRELGNVFDTAREVLGEDTFFLHTSDHGAQWPFGKWNLYEEGIHTPMIAVWPNKIAAGKQNDALVSWLDILPTLVDVAGGQTGEKLDGHSLLPLLKGETESLRDAVFTTHSGDGSRNVFPMRSIRTQQFKYIRNLYPQFRFESHVTEVPQDTNYWPSWEAAAVRDPAARKIVDAYRYRVAEELFDLSADPAEQRNLADDPQCADQLAMLRTSLDNHLTATRDTLGIYGNPDMRPLSRQPNIVTIFIDDMGYSDLGCFGGHVATPNIDSLAQQGLRFTQFYVNSPICSPSRTALTTGHYPQRHRISSYLANRQTNAKRQIANWLEPDAVTLPRMLHDAGYATGHFGKWHMGGQRDVGEAPLITEYGFDRSLTNFEGLGPRVLPLNDRHDGTPAKRYSLGSENLGHGPIEWLDRSQVTGRFVDSAVAFIDEAAAKQQPFYVNLWPDDVHSPFFPPAGTRGDDKPQTLYDSVLAAMDQQLAPLIDRIRNDESLRGNTLILVASDNGPPPKVGSSAPLRGHKGQIWEGGIRSPLIVWGPGLVVGEPSTVNETTALSSIDLVASLITLTGVTPPDDYRGDGEDLAGAVLGYAAAPRTTPMFWRRPPAVDPLKKGYHPDLAIRDGQWKLVCKIGGKRPQLYNLADDVEESNDVSASKPVITKRLLEQLLAWDAQLPPDATSDGL